MMDTKFPSKELRCTHIFKTPLIHELFFDESRGRRDKFMKFSYVNIYCFLKVIWTRAIANWRSNRFNLHWCLSHKFYFHRCSMIINCVSESWRFHKYFKNTYIKMNMPYLLKVKKALKITRIPILCRLGGFGKSRNLCTCLPAGRFMANICH
jgi:hypothetical protein